ncbi:MAG: NfeD family protein [Bacteroidota bacterium]|nr:NfeD family protein [Bacteroidota bacterium]
MKKLFVWVGLFVTVCAMATPVDRDKKWDANKKVTIYTFAINKEIGPSVWRITQKAFSDAGKQKADLIIIHMNTYGGQVDAADSIRTKILNSPVPVYVFIDNNAASAGALISIAADRIYMREGASIGAATVVNQTGAAMPDKYQSFMRSMMRATAESHGKEISIIDNDTIIKWRRDPRIAEAMVDPRTFIPGVNDTGKVLTFTTNEAIKLGYCEGKANSLSEVIAIAGIKNYDLKEYHLTAVEYFIGFLVNPLVQGILIMLMIAGIYYELQTPGIGLPIIAALIAASFYFFPLYIDGLAQNWEIVLFVIGLILIGLEIFVVPGFGITGISGIVLVVAGLTLSMVDNRIFDMGFFSGILLMSKSLFVVVLSVAVSLGASIYLSGKMLSSSRIGKIALKVEQQSSEGYVSFDDKSGLVGSEGEAVTILRPSGKVNIDGEVYDSIAETGYINPGETVIVTKCESGQLYVTKKY